MQSGAIFQFNHAASQADMDAGRLGSIQLHLAADKLRAMGEELLRIADRLGT